MTENVNDRARRLVSNEVTACLSSIVSTLASEYGNLKQGSLNDLVEEAFELCTPVPDYEEAAYQNGWQEGVDGTWSHAYLDSDGEMVTDVADSAEEACDMDRIDAEEYSREIYEHWAVSDRLANKLTDYGERAGYFDNFKVWGRTCTGQAIYGDHVIQRIAADLLASK